MNSYKSFFPSDVEIPTQFPNDLVPVRLYLDEIVSDKENEFIVFDKHFHQIIDSKRYPASSSEWVGEIGKTQEFVLKYVNCFGFQSQFGYTHIYNFEDKDGNIIKTMTTRTLDIETDTWYSITARVKSHAGGSLRKEQNFCSRSGGKNNGLFRD